MANTITVQLEQTSGSSSEARIRDHRVAIDRPESKGGGDSGPMGGELLLAALAGCFMSNLLAAIKSREAPLAAVGIEARGSLGGTPPRFEAIDLRVSAAGADGELLAKLTTISERACIVANTLAPAVELTVGSALRKG